MLRPSARVGGRDRFGPAGYGLRPDGQDGRSPGQLCSWAGLTLRHRESDIGSRAPASRTPPAPGPPAEHAGKHLRHRETSGRNPT